ncbi:MAG TPA: glycerol-3-phosphate 1-O-acyltransferase PlsY [Gemmatimonadaceae bacterium]|nr:glycerol-3-phosphate 1-O-acyltransferase PlsY [Gemmatimonadaceae bacterium]
MRHLVPVLLAYLLGSIPFAYVAGRMLRGIDLREHGSGNLGATNVQRTLGTPVAAVVLLLDAAKGAVPTLLFARWFGIDATSAWPLVFGLAAIVGHVRPLYLAGKGGGKGVATSTGVFLAAAPLATLIAIAVFAGTVAISRYASLGSLLGAASLPIAIVLMQQHESPVLVTSIAVALFVFWTHRSNISRLRRGEEARITGRVHS